MSSTCVGEPAPDFSLDVQNDSENSKRVCLADYRGRWLALLFYPRDFSFVCPTELTDFSAKHELFAERNCELLAISPDTLESHREWLSTPASQGGVQGLRYPLGSDTHAVVCRAYGVWRKKQELPNRGLFLIDPSGFLRYSVVHDLAVGRNATDTLRVLDALISGGLCPSNWTGTDGVLDVESMLQPGRVLGHYRIVSELGRGAFGVVLAADDVRLGRRVALKIFQQQSTESTTKLISEAHAAAVIEHANVCTIHAIDEIDGMSTIVMEYIDGGSLSDMIRSKPDESAVRKIVHQIAAGLRAAHDKGVVHGDLKPANVLLRHESEPVIVDFGLAKSRLTESSPTTDDPGSPSAIVSPIGKDVSADATIDAPVDWNDVDLHQPLDSTLSQTLPFTSPQGISRKISGTPAYMSPEQARGDSINGASDIFSLGMIVTEMLIGQRPHGRENAVHILQRLQDPGVVQSIADQVPQKYRHSVAAMLANRPSDRPSAGEVESWFA